MKSNSSLILEGLLHNRLNEGRIGSFDEVPVIHDSRRAEKLISQALTSKYQKVFQAFGTLSIDVDIYTSDDRDLMVDDAVSTMGITIMFEEDINGKERQIQSAIKKYMKYYPEFKYEKSDSSFWIEKEDYDGIIEILGAIESDRVNLKNVYSVVSSDEINARIERQNKEWEDDRKYLEREYNRSRL